MSVPWSVYQTALGNSGTDGNAPLMQGAINPTGTVYSKMWSGRQADGYSLTVITTGTLSGTFTLWSTDKPNPSEANDNDWIQDTGFTPINPAGGAVSFNDETGNFKAYRKRLKYVHSSGSGIINAFVTAPKMS